MRLDTIYLDLPSWELVAACRDFYRDVLGLPVRSEEDGESVWLGAGDDVSVGFHTGGEAVPVALACQTNLAFRVSDLSAAIARCVEHGVALASEPWDAPWGMRVVTLTDPAGHAVWLQEPIPPGGSGVTGATGS